MGFFAAEVTKPVITPRGRGKNAANIDPALIPKGCDHCGLKRHWPTLTTPRMALSGNTKDADVLILGEAPGEQEDRDGSAFVGRSGALLRRVIPGRFLDRIAFQNVVRCRPVGNATPTHSDCHSCSAYLEDDIASLPNLKAILGLGSVPLSRFYPGQSIMRIHAARMPVRIADRDLWFYPAFHPSFVLRSGDENSPAFGVLQADVKAFFLGLDSWDAPMIWQPDTSHTIYPQDEAEARYCLDQMVSPKAIDLESQKLKPYLKGAALLTAAISDGDITIAFPIDHPEVPTNWGLGVLLDVAGSEQWIAHNAAMELLWMLFYAEKAGIDWRPHAFEDSMALGRCYHARETILSMAMMSRIHLGIDIKTLSQVNLNNMIAEPLEKILPYNGLDAQASALLWRALHDKVDQGNYRRFVDTVHSATRMELRGLEPDLAVTDELTGIWQAKAEAAVTRSKLIYEVRQFESQRQTEFNIASGVHIGEALVEYGRINLPKTSKKVDGAKTEGIVWATDEETLRQHAGDNPLALVTLEYREAQQHLSTFIIATRRHAEASIDGWIHPSYTTMHTATTRTSCNDPNAQNYPTRRHREIRRQIIPDRMGAPRKHIFLAVDMGQIDARVYGCATKDHNLCQSFIDKEDIHRKWLNAALELYPDYLDRLADKTNETEEKDIIKGARNIIKSDFVFASFYGSDAGACANRTGIPLRLTRDLVDGFWKEYPDAWKWLKRQRRLYAETGSIFTLCGVERHGLLTGNEPINTPIQGTTSHIVHDAQNALSYLAIQRGDPYLHPRLEIHDDLTFVVPDEPAIVMEYIDIIAAEMTKIRYPWQIVPLIVEIKIGDNLCDLEEIAVISGDYVR